MARVIDHETSTAHWDMLTNNGGSSKKQRRSNSDAGQGGRCVIPLEIFNCLRDTRLLDEETVRQLAPLIRLRRLGGGDLIIREGTQGQAVFIVLQGTAVLYSEASETEIGELGPGNVLGEIGALLSVPRTMTVRAKAPGCTVGILLKDTILTIPSLVERLLGLAEERLLADEQRDLAVRALCPGKNQILEQNLEEQFGMEADKSCGRFVQREDKHLLLLAQSPMTVRVLEGRVRVRPFNASEDTGLVHGPGRSVSVQRRDVVQAMGPATIYFERENPISDPQLLEEGMDTFDAAAIDQAGRLSQILSPSGVHRRRSIAVWSDETFLRPTPLTDPFHPKKRAVSEAFLAHTLAHTSTSSTDDDVVGLLERLGIPAEAHRTSIISNRGPAYDRLGISFDPIHQYFDNETLEAVLLLFGELIVQLDFTDCWALSDSALVRVMKLCPRLEKIVLANCWAVTESGFARALQLAPKQLTHLTVQSCPGLTDAALKHISRLHLRHLDVSLCKNLGGQAWTAIVGQAKWLQSLAMRRCSSIPGDDIVAQRGDFCQLQSLDLSDCPFLPDAAICSIISTSPNLSHLNISFCHALDTSFFPLLHQANPNGSLRDLVIEHCHKFVTDDAISFIVQHWPALERLSARGCTLLTDGAVDHLSRLSSLKRLDLSACPAINPAHLATTALARSWALDHPPTEF